MSKLYDSLAILVPGITVQQVLDALDKDGHKAYGYPMIDKDYDFKHTSEEFEELREKVLKGELKQNAKESS